MSFRLVHENWAAEFERALRVDRSELRIVCPFIKVGALDRLLALCPERIRVITRFNLNDFAVGVSDISSLRALLEHGASVRGIRHLHAKFYVFGQGVAIVTSANLTRAGLASNHEFGLVTEDRDAIASCCRYFDDLWSQGHPDLRGENLADWVDKLSRHHAGGAPPREFGTLPDYGADGRLIERSHTTVPPLFADAGQGFVKFHGVGHDRVPLSTRTLDELDDAGCHWALWYPRNKRPQIVQKGALMFIARLTEEPGLSRVFGRAIAMAYQPKRDDATPADIERRPWTETWCHCVRVHHAEFLNGTLENGISLGELIDTLGTDSFVTTQKRAADGEADINPRLSVRRQPAVRLTQQGRDWLNERLQAAFDLYGGIPPSELEGLDWPGRP